MKIVVNPWPNMDYSPWVEQTQAAHPDLDIELVTGLDALAQALPEAEVLVTHRSVPQQLAERASNLRWIQALSAGVDHYLPMLDHCPLAPVLTRCPIHGQIMAEYALWALLTCRQQHLQHMANQRKGRWQRRPISLLEDWHLLIMGLGTIGHRVAQVVHQHGVRVTGYQRHPEAAPDYVQAVVGPDQKEQAIRTADAILLLLPLTDETHHMIGGHELSLMRDGAYLINIGRGGLVDETALRHALEERTIAGAVLDVFEQEPLAEDSPLWSCPNLLVTPHVSGFMTDYEKAAWDLVLDNLERYRAGEKLKYQFDPDRGY